jgi:hypothetical protein
MAIAIAFAFQYGVAKYVVNISISNYVTDAWLSGCNDFDTDALIVRCAGQAGVYRSGFSAFVFFILAAVAVAFRRSANREAWPAKYILFLFFVLAMCFVPNEPLFTDIYINIARVGAVFFILFQQIIFVDIAHNWNWFGTKMVDRYCYQRCISISCFYCGMGVTLLFLWWVRY